MDIHDRHWKIHWMLNFAQLSATLNLRAVDGEGARHGRRGAARPAAELRRRPQLGLRRGPLADEGVGQGRRRAAAAFDRHRRAEIRAALEATERGRRFVAEQLAPYQREFGWRAVWSHEFIFPTWREDPEPDPRAGPRLPRDRLRLPERAGEPCARTWRRPPAELLEGLEGAERDELRRGQRDQPAAWRRSPPTTTSTSTRAPTPGCRRRARHPRREARRGGAARRRRRRAVPALQRAARLRRRPVGARRAGRSSPSGGPSGRPRRACSRATGSARSPSRS